MPKQSAFERRISDIADLVERLERSADPGLRATAQELVQALMDLHGAGLGRVLELAGQGGAAGPALVEQWGRDPLIRSLLLLHGLHPVDLKTRVLEGLEQARPYLRSHGGNVELVEVDEGGAVRLRMQGSCHGCPSSSVTLKLAIEDAIREAAPDVTTIVVDGSPAAPAHSALVVLESASAPAAGDEVQWEDLAGITDLPAGAARLLSVGDRDLLCCRIEDALYAYSDRCPACTGSLADAAIRGAVLVCPGCGQTYDVVKAGCGLDRPDLHLDPFPVLRKNGRARVALPLLRAATGSL